MRKFHYAGAALAALLAVACGEQAGDAYDADETGADKSEAYESPTAAQNDRTAAQDRTQRDAGEANRTPESSLTIAVAESGEYGRYLTDGNGRPLYMFTADTKGDETRDAVIACSGGCLEAWPLAVTKGAPKAASAVDAGLVGRVEHNGKSVVTYNGWPLYYFAQDSGAGSPQGQEIESFGGTWRLVTPDGMKAGEEKDGAM